MQSVNPCFRTIMVVAAILAAFLGAAHPLASQIKPKVYVIPEAAELNKIYDNCGGNGWTEQGGWPVSGTESPTEPDVYGVSFGEAERDLGDRILVTCRVEYIGLSYNNLTGSIPQLNFPDLIKFDFEGNKLTGAVKWPSCPKLERMYLNANKLTGAIPQLSYPNLVSLFLNGNEFSGAVHNFAGLPNIEVLALESNKLTGSIPAFSQQSLIAISLGNNALTGSIPDFSLPNLINLWLDNNKLTGQIPALRGCTKLADLDVSSNELTGSIPAFSQTGLMAINVRFNKLSGPLPTLTQPELVHFWASSNLIDGAVPAYSLPKLETLLLDNNKLSGQLPAMNIPKLKSLDISSNKLEGPLPQFNLPELSSLSVNGNKFTGILGALTAPKLEYISAGGNYFDSLVNIKTRFPIVRRLDCVSNTLHFGHLLPNKGITQFYYSPQRTMPVRTEVTNNVTRIWVTIGGAGNQYQWFKDEVEIPNETKFELLLANPGKSAYKCRITNPSMADLTLWSDIAEPVANCLNVGPVGTPWLQICSSDATWTVIPDKPIKELTGSVTFNDYLRFQGKITVDTAYYKISCIGEFVVPDVPLPGGGTTDYLIAKGNFVDLQVLDSAKLVNFVNQTYEDKMSFCGFKVKLKDLRIAGGFPPTGIILAISIEKSGLSASCGIPSRETELEIKGINVGTQGIWIEEVELKNLGLYYPGWCLKKGTWSKDYDKDIVRAGLELETPIGEVGGGLSLSKGGIDSIAWRYESDFPPKFVLGTTTVGIAGFFGHVSGFVSKELEVELGGIFTDITNPFLYNVDVAGMLKSPATLQGRAEPHILRKPGTDYWQIVGEASVSYDFSESLMQLAGELKMATTDGENYYFNTKGSLKMSNKLSPPTMAGKMKGSIVLPKLSDKLWPFTWLSSMFNFPITASCDVEFTKRKFSVLAGSLKVTAPRSSTYVLDFVANMDKSIGSPDFMTWKYTKSATLPSGVAPGGGASLFALRTDNFTIPAGLDMAIVEIRGFANPEAGTLRDPGGNSYTSTSADSSIILSRTANNAHAFWTLITPVAGQWSIERSNPAATDTVFVYTFAPSPPFAITVRQLDRTVTVTWDATGLAATDSVYVLLDEDQENGDGQVVGKASAASGSAVFQLTDDLSRCEYYVYASLEMEAEIRSAYGSKVSAQKTGILAPEGVHVVYNPSTSEATVSWTPRNEAHILGYAVHLIDGAGRDSVVADMFREESSVTLSIPQPDGMRIALQSYDENSHGSCLSEAVYVVVSVADNVALPKEPLLHRNYPNPFNPSTTLSFTLPEVTIVRLSVTDMLGRRLALLIDGEVLAAGTHRRMFNAAGLPSGMYLYRLETREGSRCEKMLLLR